MPRPVSIFSALRKQIRLLPPLYPTLQPEIRVSLGRSAGVGALTLGSNTGKRRSPELPHLDRVLWLADRCWGGRFVDWNRQLKVILLSSGTGSRKLRTPPNAQHFVSEGSKSACCQIRGFNESRLADQSEQDVAESGIHDPEGAEAVHPDDSVGADAVCLGGGWGDSPRRDVDKDLLEKVVVATAATLGLRELSAVGVNNVLLLLSLGAPQDQVLRFFQKHKKLTLEDAAPCLLASAAVFAEFGLSVTFLLDMLEASNRQSRYNMMLFTPPDSQKEVLTVLREAFGVDVLLKLLRKDPTLLSRSAASIQKRLDNFKAMGISLDTIPQIDSYSFHQTPETIREKCVALEAVLGRPMASLPLTLLRVPCGRDRVKIPTSARDPW